MSDIFSPLKTYKIHVPFRVANFGKPKTGFCFSKCHVEINAA